MGGFFAGDDRSMLFEPLPFTTVVVRLAVHGLFASPGRQSHTVPDDAAAAAVPVDATRVGPRSPTTAPMANRMARALGRRWRAITVQFRRFGGHADVGPPGTGRR